MIVYRVKTFGSESLINLQYDVNAYIADVGDNVVGVQYSSNTIGHHTYYSAMVIVGRE